MKKRIYAQDFIEVFGIPYLPSLVVEASELYMWDLHQDKEYKINIPLNEKLSQQYGPLISQQYTAPMYITWVNKIVEYGVFAQKKILKGDLISEYTGYVCLDGPEVDNAYLWDYPTIIYEDNPGKKRRKKKIFCIDAGRGGNYARFINHTHRAYQNVATQIIAYEGLWHIVYIAQKDIEIGQQLLTHYGVGYWRERKLVPKPLFP